MTSSRIVSFAGQCLIVEYDSDSGGQIAKFLYRDLDSAAVGEPRATLAIEYGAGGNVFTLYRNGEQFFSALNRCAVATALVAETIFQLVDKNAAGLLLHAAAVARDGRGILLPGDGGAGKSTLAAWLVRHGYNYLTDEMVFIPEHTREAKGFTRPIKLRAESLPVIGELIDLDGQENRILNGSHVTMVPHRLFNPHYTAETPEVHAVIFPRYDAGAGLKLERLSHAKTAATLMKFLVNARNLEGYGLPQAAHVARSASAYRLTYSRFDQLPEVLEEILG